MNPIAAPSQHDLWDHFRERLRKTLADTIPSTRGMDVEQQKMLDAMETVDAS